MLAKPWGRAIVDCMGPRNNGLYIYEKEYLAILVAVQQRRLYLQLGEFVIRTDHKSLTNLTQAASPHRLAEKGAEETYGAPIHGAV
jgi:hypothetical protein